MTSDPAHLQDAPPASKKQAPQSIKEIFGPHYDGFSVTVENKSSHPLVYREGADSPVGAGVAASTVSAGQTVVVKGKKRSGSGPDDFIFSYSYVDPANPNESKGQVVGLVSCRGVGSSTQIKVTSSGEIEGGFAFPLKANGQLVLTIVDASSQMSSTTSVFGPPTRQIN